MANVLESVDATRQESSDEKWAQWQEKGVRHDARVARNMIRLAVALALVAGAVWAAVGLL